MKGTKAIHEALKREKVENIFCIPGGAVIPLFDEFYSSDIRRILVRHEQAAAHAADGYARASGKAGVCIATSGPGATNLVTGIATAYLDSSPVVAFTGQVPTVMIGKDAFQEADIRGITMPITKHNFMLTNPAEIPEVIRAAFKIATTGRPGPVVIDLPKDVQEKEADMKFKKDVEIVGYKPTVKGHAAQIKRAAELILAAQRPIILAGGGVIIGSAHNELFELATMLNIPVATTLMGKGCFPEDHPLALGLLGMHGRKAANYAINDADVIIAIGCRFSDRTTGNVNCFAPEAKIIHIDIDPAEIGKNVEAYIPVVGDAKHILREMIKIIKTKLSSKKGKSVDKWFEKIKKYKKEFAPKMDYEDIPLKPPRIVKELNNLLDGKDIVTTEVGQCQMWAAHFLIRKHPRTFISSGGLGTMGFGFPAAIGAKVAKPEVKVIDFAGDGSFLMNSQELATSVSENIPVVVALMDNHYLGMVRQWQQLFYDRHYSSVFLGEVPDFVKLAEAYGARGIRVEKPSEIRDAFLWAFKQDVTVVVDFIIDREANVLPMVPPGGCLKDIVE